LRKIRQMINDISLLLSRMRRIAERIEPSDSAAHREWSLRQQWNVHLDYSSTAWLCDTTHLAVVRVRGSYSLRSRLRQYLRKLYVTWRGYNSHVCISDNSFFNFNNLIKKINRHIEIYVNDVDQLPLSQSRFFIKQFLRIIVLKYFCNYTF